MSEIPFIPPMPHRQTAVAAVPDSAPIVAASPMDEGPFLACEHVFTSDQGNTRVVLSLPGVQPTAPEGFPKYYTQRVGTRKFDSKAERDAALG